MNWYVYDLGTGKTDFDHEHKVVLGTIRVGDLSIANIARTHNARVGDAITFLGWSSQPAPNSDSIAVVRGQSLNLDLYWRADRTIRESFTVFVHLIDASARVVADADSPPCQGLFPTDRWASGETVRDRHPLTIPKSLAPGNYSIEIGMYLPATGIRLPIETPSMRTDKIVLSQVSVF